MKILYQHGGLSIAYMEASKEYWVYAGRMPVLKAKAEGLHDLANAIKKNVPKPPESEDEDELL